MIDKDLEFLGVSEPPRLFPPSQSPRSHQFIKNLRQSLTTWASSRTDLQNLCGLKQGLGIFQGAALTFVAGAAIATLQGKIEAKAGVTAIIGGGAIVYALSRQAESGIEEIEEEVRERLECDREVIHHFSPLEKEVADLCFSALQELSEVQGSVGEMKLAVLERLEHGDRCSEVLYGLSGGMCGEPEQIGVVLRRKINE